MHHIIRCIIIYFTFCLIACSLSVAVFWTVVHEDQTEYQLLQSDASQGPSQCLLSVDDEASLVQYSDGVCSQFRCKLGLFGCRKCRNFINNSFPMFYLKYLDEVPRCWITFQHRVDASVNFTKPWINYVSGFGQGEDANYWMGLEKLYQLTKDGGRRARWEFSDWNGTWYWSENSEIRLSGASDKYRVHLGALDTNRSNVGQVPLNDGRSMHNRQFSTIDSDNDAKSNISCAVGYQSAWWFSYCASFDPNRKYINMPGAVSLSSSNSWKGIVYTFENSPYPLVPEYSMRSFECLIN